MTIRCYTNLDSTSNTNVMTLIRKRYINSSYGQIHCRFSGDESSPVLVMLHQTASSSVMFEKLMRLLPEFLVIAPDTLGYGASSDPQGTPTIKQYSESLREILSTLDVSNIILFGHHTGSAIAVQFAHDYPEMVIKLILGGPPYLSDEQKIMLKKSLKSTQLTDKGTHLQATWERIKSRSLSGDLELIQRETLLTLRATRYSETYQAVFKQDFASLLTKINCPALIICGEHDTIRTSAEPTHNALVNSEIIILPNSGTLMCDENSEQVAETIRQFINK